MTVVADENDEQPVKKKEKVLRASEVATVYLLLGIMCAEEETDVSARPRTETASRGLVAREGGGSAR